MVHLARKDWKSISESVERHLGFFSGVSPTCPWLEMAAERSGAGELACETVVAGVSPIALHRAALFL